VIVTLTANPSIDETIKLGERLSPGAVHLAASVTSQSGGKGVNICRAAYAAGVPSLAVFPVADGHHYLADLRHAGLNCRVASTTRQIRTNITVSEPSGTTTKLNSPGERMAPEVLDALAGILVEEARSAEWVVIAGSLPPGVAPGWYAELVRALRQTQAGIAVDTSGAALRAVADSDCPPDLLKPNGAELASLVGAVGTALEDDPLKAAAAAQDLVEGGVGSVLATLGGYGAVLADRGGSWLATSPPIAVASTVGAGDSSLFGYLWGSLRDLDPPDRLRLAVAYGSSAAALPGTGLPSPDQINPAAVRVTAL
jgi:1-phosphofructokinase